MPVRKRPSLFGYFSFGSTAPSNRHDRSSSISAHLRPGEDKEREKKQELEERTVQGQTKDMNSGSRSRLIKLVGLFGAIFMMIYWLGPSDRRDSVKSYVQEHAPANLKAPIFNKPTTQLGQTAADESTGTTKCKSSSSITKPPVQYVLMVDAGSTGSRIHTYRFNNCAEMPELEEEYLNKTQPGLSSYGDEPERAAASLDILLDAAMAYVPEKLRACTPIAVKATAGLRMLGEVKSQKILDAVRHRLETRYPFPVVSREENGVAIMDGKDEGVYAWITVNYLLGKIGTLADTPTAAIFDLGGGSTQIVFEPTFDMIGGGMPKKLEEGDHKYTLEFGGRFFDLYQHSHLGYGLMQARKRIHRIIVDGRRKAGDWDEKSPLVNPCIAPGMRRVVEVEFAPDDVLKVEMVGPKENSAAQCRALAEKMLNKEASCSLAPCSFNGVHQPPFERTFAKEDVYIFSYFYDRAKPIGMPSSFSIKELKDITAKVCGGKESWSSFQNIEGAIAELEDRPEYCLDLNFMIALLHTGYEMPLDREVKTAAQIKGRELGWCLGASLPLLDQGKGGWRCRLTEVS